jgi:gamma-glutamyltranspeptidase / glutathione hydrolase
MFRVQVAIAWILAWGTIVCDFTPEIEWIDSAAGHDRPTGPLHQSRSVVMAQHGIVATSQPLAALAGLEVLRAGGNAADAAIATNAVLGVVEPMSCGMGGDLFVIYWEAKTQKIYGLNASGRSPYDLNRDVFAKQEMKQIPSTGPLSWSVPGCVAGWEDLRSRWGTWQLARLLEPAIRYAEDGFPVTEVIAADWQSSAAGLSRWPDSARTFLPGGKPPASGEMFRNPDLAASYRAVAAGGPDAFYRGPIAQQIASYSKAHGGYFSLRDFAEHKNEWVEPVSTSYRGHTIFELPPNGQGIAALEMLNVLEGFDLRALGPNNPEYWHLFVEAKKLAFADRAKFYADPAFAPLPIKQLISKEYGNRQRRRIDPGHAALDVPAGDPRLEHGDTIYLTVVDQGRNCCSFIQSNFSSFGSQVVPGQVGFALQNRGCLFALDKDHINRLEPHKRPFHTIIPALAMKDGKPWLVFGVMGGDMQAQGHVQVLISMIDFDMNVQQAGDAARVRHSGSAAPTGEAADSGGGTVYVESGIPDAAVEALRAKGHRVVRARSGYGGYQAIQLDWARGALHGGSDPRKDGCAVGY